MQRATCAVALQISTAGCTFHRMHTPAGTLGEDGPAGCLAFCPIDSPAPASRRLGRGLAQRFRVRPPKASRPCRWQCFFPDRRSGSSVVLRFGQPLQMLALTLLMQGSQYVGMLKSCLDIPAVEKMPCPKSFKAFCGCYMTG